MPRAFYTVATFGGTDGEKGDPAGARGSREQDENERTVHMMWGDHEEDRDRREGMGHGGQGCVDGERAIVPDDEMGVGELFAGQDQEVDRIHCVRHGDVCGNLQRKRAYGKGDERSSRHSGDEAQGA